MIPVWRIPRMWENGECWIIGGGPSMPREFGVPEDVIQKVFARELPISAYSPYLSPIHNKHVIGVNAAFYLGTWIDVVFFGDAGFYFGNKRDLNKFPKLKVCANPNLQKKTAEEVQGIKYIPWAQRRPSGIFDKSPGVSWNLNSGACAINLAYHFGVKRVYLLGYDMQLDSEDRQHWHKHYNANVKKKKKAKKLPFNRHLKGFPHVAADAERLGLEIINVCPDSAIKQFPRVSLKDVL